MHEKQRLHARARLLAMRRGELPEAIARLMSKCLSIEVEVVMRS